MCDDVEDVLSGPYKATKLWNDIISNFRGKVPLRKHRRQMRQFDNCFAACEAIDFLHTYLSQNPNFGRDVSRNQTILLLRKLLQCRIFEAVHAGRISQPNEFKDNRDLYKFTQHSPSKIVQNTPGRTPFRARTGNDVNAMSEQRKRNGTNSQPNDAKLTKLNSEEGIPECRLVTRRLTIPEIENTWKAVTLGRLQSLLNLHTLENILDIKSINPKFIIHNVNRVGPKGVTLPINQAEELPHWLFNAMKCLAVWPKASGGGSCLPNYPGFEQDVFKVVRDYFDNLEEPLTTFRLYNVLMNIFEMSENSNAELVEEESASIPMTSSMEDLVSHMAKAWKAKPSTLAGCSPADSASCPNLPEKIRILDSGRVRANTKLKRDACFETAFLTASPVTRVISPSGRCPSGRSYANGCVNLAYADNSSEEYFAEAESEDSDESDKDLEREAWWMARSRNRTGTSFRSAVSYQSRGASRATNGSGLSTATLPNFGRIKNARVSPRSVGAVSAGIPDAHFSRMKSEDHRENQGHLNEEARSFVTEGMQFALLCLPPNNRRKLHFLLRFMSKISSNEKLQLDRSLSNRTLVLDTFSRSLLRAHQEADYNEVTAHELAIFLMDNHETVLSVPPTLKARVEERLNAMSQNKIKYGADDDASFALTYCQQVTKEEYEQQSALLAERAMSDLLDGILADPHLSDREKRKKLKRFKKMYPDIYSRRFPEVKKSTASFSKSLKKLTGMRM